MPPHSTEAGSLTLHNTRVSQGTLKPTFASEAPETVNTTWLQVQLGLGTLAVTFPLSSINLPYRLRMLLLEKFLAYVDSLDFSPHAKTHFISSSGS